ncbi:MAG: phosphate signaling complex protein PhoU [Candidatus Krumholzibacteria bacterium]|nr:phosphate signaling complex protein PhoU [Candidatus Krumholzibacteria bacterium]
MSRHIEREIEKLKREILALGAVVEESLHNAVSALERRDPELARQTIDGDPAIDQMEVDVEENCLKVLALHQPVARDLRLIIAILKINNDLERVGDLAVNIAERALFLATREKIEIPLDFVHMADVAKKMLKKSLDALVGEDPALAHEVCRMDDEVDAINREMYGVIQGAIRKQPERLESLIHLLSVSRHLERVGDSATNIAEDVIYMIEGVIVRHKVEKYQARDSS